MAHTSSTTASTRRRWTVAKVFSRRNTIGALEFCQIGWPFKWRCIIVEKLIGRNGFGTAEFLLCLIIFVRIIFGATGRYFAAAAAAIITICRRRRRIRWRLIVRLWWRFIDRRKHWRNICVRFDRFDFFKAHHFQLTIPFRYVNVAAAGVIVEKFILWLLVEDRRFRAVATEFWRSSILSNGGHVTESRMRYATENMDYFC